VACTSQKAGVPVETFAGTGFADTIEVAGIETAASAVHASCAEAEPEVTRVMMTAYAASTRTLERWCLVLMVLVSVQAPPTAGPTKRMAEREKSPVDTSTSLCQ
jgi:hypothetical protein